jgi:hypothetical protein
MKQIWLLFRNHLHSFRSQHFCSIIKMASTAGTVIKSGVKQVRPLLSVDNAEARKRVLNLYKAWYRQVPYIGK